MNNKITIDGVDCLMSSSVHQSMGDIFFRKDPKDQTYYIFDMFTEEERNKVVKYLEDNGCHPNYSDSTHFNGWGRRTSLISIFMGQEAIQEAFVDYFNKQINK